MDRATALAIPHERDQLRALMEMRWHVFVRTMRNNNAKITFALWLAGRILVFLVALGVGALCGFLVYLATDGGPLSLSKVFLYVMLSWQGMALLRDQQAGVELELLRFPLRLRTYIGLWLAAGALEGITILGTLACTGLFVGLLFVRANPLRSAVAVGLFLVCNLTLARAVSLWMGRMLARRRTRELVLVLFSIIGILPRLLRGALSQVSTYVHRLPLPPAFYKALQGLPSALAAHAAYGGTGMTVPFTGVLLWDIVVGAVLVIGLRRAFRGEHLQEFAAATEPRRMAARATTHAGPADRGSHPALVVAGMEWARLRHGGTALYGTITPLLYVALFGLRLGRTSLGFWMLPMVAAYLGITLRSYNVFGADGTGVQTFMLLPTPLRVVLMGKNLFAAAIYSAQLAAGTLLVAFVAHRLSGPAACFTVAWAACHMAVNLGLGNTRSVRVPTRVAADRVALRGKRGNANGGGWVALACILGVGLLGAILVALSAWWHHPWFAPVAMLPFTLAATEWYRRSLNNPLLGGDIRSMETLGLVVARTG